MSTKYFGPAPAVSPLLSAPGGRPASSAVMVSSHGQRDGCGRLHLLGKGYHDLYLRGKLITWAGGDAGHLHERQAGEGLLVRPRAPAPVRDRTSAQDQAASGPDAGRRL